MVVVRVQRWLQFSRVLLGTSAVLDLVVRFSSVAVEIMTRLPEDIFVPLLSVVGGMLGSSLVSFVTTWLLFAVVFYTVGHLAYSHLEIVPKNEIDTGFRIIFVMSTLMLGISFNQVLSTQTIADEAILIAAVLPFTAGGGSLLLIYLVKYHGWEVLHHQGDAIKILKLIYPHQEEAVEQDIKTDLSYQGSHRTV
jgi:hypothetical protein